MFISLAIDPFRTTPQELKLAIQKLNKLSFKTSKIHFLYVSNRNESALNTAFEFPDGAPRYVNYPHEKLLSLFKKAQLKVAPKQIAVLFEDTNSLKSVARRFDKESKKRKTSAIAVYFHKKSLLERLVLGSFASAIFSEATQPVLVLK